MPSRFMVNMDNRRAPRRSVSWRARLLLANGTMVDCRAVDSSANGIGLICEVSIPLGEPLKVALQVPDEQTGQLQVQVHEGTAVASVLTPLGYRVGVQFTVDPLLEMLDAMSDESMNTR